ncbi:hypothetical protein FKG94_16735 [Exilibacterium tricleocarpae]|uniref:Uncharacterized protein n=1 Tax=Exilibacterium tricleocarpae TaxID=2591008 RepID=A0A545TAK6_9GAMM|nr:hypothetical protein [Exilibacterium tricleocarpae]TQV74249.1 hypothetical protein FKG94_16735 [Exilibacterium tricleocarpae]
MTKRKRYSLDELEKMKSESDQEKFDETTDVDILEQIISDPDTPHLTEQEVKEMRPARSKERKK